MFRTWHRRYPLFFPTLAYAAGIFFASRQEWTATYRGLLGFACLAAALACGAFRGRPARHVWVSIFFFLFGLWRVGDCFFAAPPPLLAEWIRQAEAEPVLLRAEDYGQWKGSRCVFPATVVRWERQGRVQSVDFRVRLSAEDLGCRIMPGAAYRAWLRFREPRSFKNPFSFDYARYLRIQRLTANAYALSGLTPAPDFDRISSTQAFAHRLRSRFLSGLESSEVSFEARGVLEAMTVRELRHLTPETEELFRRTGLSHLLVVSGLNFGLLFALFYFPCYSIFSLVRPWAERGWASRWGAIAALAPTVLYGAMVGWTPPVLRSAMAVLWMVIAVLLGGRRHFFSLLLLTCLALWLWEPLLLLDLSFQLSFVSVAAAVRSSQEFSRLAARNARETGLFQSLGRGLLALLGMSVAVGVALYPWFASDFHELAWMGPLTNLVFIPCFSWVLMPGSLLAGLLAGFSPGAAAEIFHLLGLAVQAGLEVLRRLSAFPHATIFLGSPRFLQWPAYFLLLWSVFQISRPRRALSAIALAVFLIALQMFWEGACVAPPKMRLTMFDVGQGEALLLSLPQGRKILIDGGGLPFSDFDMGRNVLMPELLERGIRRLDAVVLTHPDADHAKGLGFFLKHGSVGEFWFTEQTWNHPHFASLRRLLEERRIPRRLLRRGDVIFWDEARLEVRWPPQDFAASDNDQSLVLRSCWKEACFLLTGDVEGEAERFLSRAEEGLQSAVLKIPHHGSRTSTSEDFLAAVSPRVAVASLGKGNRYGFPHPEVLRRLRNGGVPILRTDQEGQIEIWTDGVRIFQRSFAGKRVTEWRVPSLWSAIRAGACAGRS